MGPDDIHSKIFKGGSSYYRVFQMPLATYLIDPSFREISN